MSKNKKVEIMNSPTKESLKEKASIISNFLTEKCNVKISRSQSLELISKVFDFNDWNTASAMSESKSKLKGTSSSIQISTVADMKKALEALDDSVVIDADYTFKVKQLEDIALAELDPEAEIYQEFSLTLDNSSYNDIVTFKLKLEDESICF